MKKLSLLFIFLFFLELKSENADFTFGSAIGFGGALFYSADTITLGFMNAGNFSALSPNITVGNDPFSNYGYANHSFSFINLPSIALGETMYIKISSSWGDEFITDSSWGVIQGTNPPATPPLNAALIGHSSPSSINSIFGTVHISSGGIGGTGLNIGIVPETSSYTLFLGIISIAYAIIRRRK